jgi:hypothetical protein
MVPFILDFVPKSYMNGFHARWLKNQLTYSVVKAVVEGVDH